MREHVANRLSDLKTAPHSVVAMLADDEIDVARPVLENSLVLKNTDLIKIVKRRSQDHLKIVATREEVGEEVSGALVENGDDQVLVSLANNQGAALSQNAAAEMVTAQRTMRFWRVCQATAEDVSG